MTVNDPPKPPDAVYVRPRWVPQRTVEWTQKCERIMLEYGLVDGSTVYNTKHKARWKVRHLKETMIALRMHEGWQLKEHVGRKDGGWVWSLEYVRRRDG